MKKLFVLIALNISTHLVLLSQASFAGSVKAYSAVLALDTVKCLDVIEKIELKSTFRCPECYEFKVSGLKNYNDEHSTEFLVTTYIDAETKQVCAKLVEPQP